MPGRRGWRWTARALLQALVRPLAGVLMLLPLTAAFVAAQRPTPQSLRPPPVRAPDADSIARAAGAQQRRQAATGYGVIDGIVTDTTLRPLGDAEIAVLSSSVKVSTGDNGRFRLLHVPAGQYLLIVRKIGFHPTSVAVEVPANDTLRLAYTLDKVTQTLETVVVTEERRSFRLMQFDDRRKLGFGAFMNQAEIEKHNPVYAIDLMYQFLGVKVLDVPGGGGSYQKIAVSTRGRGAGGSQNCVLQVIVDDIPMPASFNLEWLPSPRELAGIEVYAGAATVPMQYLSLDRGCGVILIWTKG